ncbi:MAG: hypothetical protein ACK5MD_03445 [Flavobacteriales bacterium]
MDKFYTKKEYSLKKLKPKKSTVEFILNYSKAIDTVNIKNSELALVMKN